MKDAQAILLWAQAEITDIQVRLDKLRDMVDSATKLLAAKQQETKDAAR